MEMRKITAFLLSALCFFMGMTAGFLIAPIKQGIQFGNNCGVSEPEKKEEEA